MRQAKNKNPLKRKFNWKNVAEHYLAKNDTHTHTLDKNKTLCNLPYGSKYLLRRYFTPQIVHKVHS